VEPLDELAVAKERIKELEYLRDKLSEALVAERKIDRQAAITLLLALAGAGAILVTGLAFAIAWLGICP
jgi:hypothetical protein